MTTLKQGSLLQPTLSDIICVAAAGPPTCHPLALAMTPGFPSSADALRSYVGSLPPDERNALERLVAALNRQSPPALVLGTLCSGCDLVSLVLERLIDVINSMMGTSVSIQHAFSCDSSALCQRWIHRCSCWMPSLGGTSRVGVARYGVGHAALVLPCVGYRAYLFVGEWSAQRMFHMCAVVTGSASRGTFLPP